MQITLRCNVPWATFSSLVTNYTSKVWKTSQTEGFLTSPSYVTTLYDFPLVEEIATEVADSMSKWCDIVCLSLKIILLEKVCCCPSIWLIFEWFRRWPPLLGEGQQWGALLLREQKLPDAAHRAEVRSAFSHHVVQKLSRSCLKVVPNCIMSFIVQYMTHWQMFQKVESVLPAKIWRLVGCTEMISW